jgi:hypothetical protein
MVVIIVTVTERLLSTVLSVPIFLGDSKNYDILAVNGAPVMLNGGFIVDIIIIMLTPK